MEKLQLETNFVDTMHHEIYHGHRATAEFVDAARFWSLMTGERLVPCSYLRRIALQGMKELVNKIHPNNDYFQWCKENPYKPLIIEVVEQEIMYPDDDHTKNGDTYEVTFEMQYNKRYKQFQFSVNEA